MKHILTCAALLAALALGGVPSARGAVSHAAKPAVVKAVVKAATPAPACCAGGNCCAKGACCAMPGCCAADGACCAPAQGVCTSACGCLTMSCCAK